MARKFIKTALVIGVIFSNGCTSASKKQVQSMQSHHPDKTRNISMHQPPFMEHPSGDFATSILAMEDAVKRLRALPKWEKWITFNAQGQGGSADS